MSSIRIHAIADRVVLVHDTGSTIVHSELDVEQADVLLQQLERAKRAALRSTAERGFLALLADMGGLPEAPLA